MRTVNLAAIDLNLLNVVASVLEERSVSRAATKLHVTQSAVSNSLKRARELFDDPLVRRVPHGVEPTPRAVALLPPLRAWLAEARRLVEDAPRFDPATSTRTFTIACTDAIALTLLAPLLARLKTRAPNARLRLQTLDRLIAEDGLARGEVDLLIGIPPVLPPGHAAELLYRDPMTCIVHRRNPLVRRGLSLKTFAALPHVELALFGTIDETVDRALATHGLSRVVKIALPHFSAIPLAVNEGGGVATLGLRVARVFAQWLPLKVLKPPLALEPLEIRQVWHRRSEEDEAVQFLREVCREAATAKPA